MILVVGEKMTLEYINTINEKLSERIDGRESEMYIIDDGGFIIFNSGSDNFTGTWLGDVDSWLMKGLVNDDVYQTHLVKNPRGFCPIPEETTSSAVSYLTAGLLTWETLDYLKFLIYRYTTL